MHIKRPINSIIHNCLWHFHKDRLRIPPQQLKNYKSIFKKTWDTLGCPPNIFEGEDFNNKIKWLMIFDQQPKIITCSDKLAVREFIAKKIGESYLTPIYATWNNSRDIDFSILPDQFVIKTNHDSGSVWIIHDRNSFDLEKTRIEISKSLNRKYGINKGEWCYQHIQPQAFAEKLLGDPTSSVDDYKFHCSDGNVIFLQYIYNRKHRTAYEQIIDPNGCATKIQLSNHFQPGDRFSKPKHWEEMLYIAKTLSTGFKYVRVDLYSIDNKIKFGELTFYPRNGNYKGEGQATLGRLIPLDRKSHQETANKIK
ncbi:ATP-grasp fold amidoligase family protein [Ectothiorhodospira shaposhnikovii]|uniref:ATP-grasp fold amidoligase family protein n=1 Tax=Ectothiorhodospira shaposhnikovii TaxID=1054 RepID=UPI001EE7E62E|nr:ATP-grasp fold amidoligase family protein [Ectothiorhodospira shaposhnikovii]MCG5513381.1 hypothetical protein [Ectothiorhodospira shaposhnikovii]